MTGYIDDDNDDDTPVDAVESFPDFLFNECVCNLASCTVEYRQLPS